jgi:hypothetical protein
MLSRVQALSRANLTHCVALSLIGGADWTVVGDSTNLIGKKTSEINLVLDGIINCDEILSVWLCLSVRPEREVFRAG